MLSSSNFRVLIDTEWPCRLLLLFENFLTPIPQETWYALHSLRYVNIIIRRHVACNFNCLFEMKDFSRSQVVTYTVVQHVVISRKLCNLWPYMAVQYPNIRNNFNE